MIRPNFDILVELTEELERNVCDLELANQFPSHKCIEKLLCGMQRREVLRLQSQIQLKELGKSVKGWSSHVSPEQLLLKEETKQ